MIMDYQDSVGISRVRPYSDSPREIWVRWYHCQPGALPFPGITWGGSPQYEPVPNHFDGPGVFRRGAWQRPPTVSPFDGTHYSGTLEQFQFGVPLALAGGHPATVCGIPLVASAGGVVLGGTAWGSAVVRGSLAQVQRLVGSVSDRRDARGGLSQVQSLPGGVSTRVVSSGSAAVALGATGSTWTTSVVSGGLSQRQSLPGQSAVGAVVRGTLAQAQRLTGTVSSRVTSAGSAAVALAASSATWTTSVVRGGLGQVQSLPGQIRTGAAVPGSLSQVQTLGGEVTGTATPVNPITTDCVVCSGGTYTYWTVSLTGITGSADCMAQNGTWTVAHQSGTCSWLLQYPVGFADRVLLTLVPLGNATLTWFDTTGTPQVVYTTPVSSYSCLGPSNTLSLSSSPQCSGWPATITLTSM
jgi:hypothetical protein